MYSYNYCGYIIFKIGENWIVKDKTSHVTLISAMLYIDKQYKTKMQQSLIIGEPTLRSQTLEYHQEQDNQLEQKQTINQIRPRANYTQEYNQNNEVYIHNILNPR
jgi:hypothetical protein